MQYRAQKGRDRRQPYQHSYIYDGAGSRQYTSTNDPAGDTKFSIKYRSHNHLYYAVLDLTMKAFGYLLAASSIGALASATECPVADGPTVAHQGDPVGSTEEHNGGKHPKVLSRWAC